MYKPTTRIDGSPIQIGLSHVSYLAPRYTRERGGDFTDTRLSAKLASIATDTLLLVPPDISGVSVETNTEHPEIHLTEIQKLGLGRLNSRNEVRFGQLHISDNNDVPVAELVAAKYVHRLTAPREFNASREVNRRFGADLAFTPIGFIKGERDRVGYLSRYAHGVQSLDNILWNETATREQRLRSLAFAGLWMANLHNHKIIHGDAQAKNIAYDSSHAPRYIDLEGAHEIEDDVMWSQVHRLADVSNLFEPIFMPPTNAEEKTAFIDSYTEHQTYKPDMLDGRDMIDVIATAEKGD